MEELFRYTQLRQAQRLSGEQKRAVGLSLYEEDQLSPLAQELVKLNTAGGQRGAASELLASRARDEDVVEEPADLPAPVRALYDWLQFKARPIGVDDLEAAVSSLDVADLDLRREWARYADNLLLAVHDGRSSINGCIDYQLLIRICHLFRLCLAVEGRDVRVRSTASSRLIEAVLDAPIIIPTRVLSTRQSRGCRDDGRVEFPVVRFPTGHDRERNCTCSCDESCKDPSSDCIPVNTYVADLFIIKEDLARYEEGDIADIENVLAGELKVRRHRNLYRTEDTTESEQETTSSEERDHQVSEKSALQDEIKSTIDSKVNVDAGVTSTFKYGEMVTITPHANITSDHAKSRAQATARSYAKELVDRSVSKVQEKARRVQISKVTTELEDRNKHTIANTEQGAGHRAGLYYWVNRVSHAQVLNHGRHMMFDAVIPEPAALFKRLYQARLEESDDAPSLPTETIDAITRASYPGILAKYGIASTEELQPPEQKTAVQVAFSHNASKPEGDKNTGFSSHEFASPQIPDGYKATGLSFDVHASTGHPKSTDPDDEVAISIHTGHRALMVEQLNEFRDGGGQSSKEWTASGNASMNGEEGVITVALAGFSTLAFAVSGTVSILCELKHETFEKWQAKIYNLVMTDYQRRVEEYRANRADADTLVTIKGRNPFLNREIERNEIKRHVIAMLLCNYFNGIGSMMERVAPCGYPEIDFAKLERDAPVIRFFEQVIEWEYVNYLFYHSMWARKCKWSALVDEDSGDPLFDKFLMAGAARVQVPIRSGMEDYFAWFLQTGQIWGASGIPPVSGDDAYISMIQELKESKQGDYADRPGLIKATGGSDILQLTGSEFYWDALNDAVDSLALDNDVDRELLVEFKRYRIVKIEQAVAGDPTAWNITIDRPYPGPSAANLKHAVGAVYVGAPWEIVIPTKLVYLRNTNDTLPTYPLS